jgi:hypothetical protein
MGWTELSSTVPLEVHPHELARKPFLYITSVRVTGVDGQLATTLRRSLETQPGMMVSDAPLTRSSACR